MNSKVATEDEARCIWFILIDQGYIEEGKFTLKCEQGIHLDFNSTPIKIELSKQLFLEEHITYIYLLTKDIW